jgi:hypothetical protein
MKLVHEIHALIRDLQACTNQFGRSIRNLAVLSVQQPCDRRFDFDNCRMAGEFIGHQVIGNPPTAVFYALASDVRFAPQDYHRVGEDAGSNRVLLKLLCQNSSLELLGFSISPTCVSC